MRTDLRVRIANLKESLEWLEEAIERDEIKSAMATADDIRDQADTLKWEVNDYYLAREMEE